MLVPAPRQLTLERQLNKSVLISWTAPEGIGPGNHIESYHVYVDGVLKTTIKATERTRALVEGVDSNRVSLIISFMYPKLFLFCSYLESIKKQIFPDISNLLFSIK